MQEVNKKLAKLTNHDIAYVCMKEECREEREWKVNAVHPNRPKESSRKLIESELAQ